MSEMDNLPVTQATNHRLGHRGRPSQLNDPEFCTSVAQAFAAGATRETMCEIFGVKDPMTITRWRKDARVKIILHKLIEDRVLAITRKVDNAIEAKLRSAESLSVKDLLDIRKEFLGGALRQQTEKADSEDINEMQAWLEDNPDAQEKLDEFLGKAS